MMRIALLFAGLVTATFAATCDNYDEVQCGTQNDGGCACFWDVNVCAKNASACSGTGITSDESNCSLGDGREVPHGWSGSGAGEDWCRTCSCESGSVVCSEDTMVCAMPVPNCTLTDGTNVSHGWFGSDTGSNSCNHCTCTGGDLGCTDMACNLECTLSDGATVVPIGWSGNDLGSNFCNTCGCQEGGLLFCTLMACIDPESWTCTLSDGNTTVPHNWSGNDVGSNYCNRCNCQAGSLGCTRAACASECMLSDGHTAVPLGWSGKDTGANWCNECSCTRGDLLCDAMACEVNCTLSDRVTVVPSGWHGKDVGSNRCNSCSCLDGGLACTQVGCCACDGGEGLPVCEQCEDGSPLESSFATNMALPLLTLPLLFWAL